MCEWSLNNSKKVHKYFGNFLISKEAYLTKYQNKKSIKIIVKGVFCQTNSKQTQTRPTRSEAQTRSNLFSLFFFFLVWVGSIPAIWSELDPANPARLLVQTSNRLASLQACVGSHAYYSSYVIKLQRRGKKKKGDLPAFGAGERYCWSLACSSGVSTVLLLPSPPLSFFLFFWFVLFFFF